MKVYFACALAGGRPKNVPVLVEYLKALGHEVLSDHVGAADPGKAMAEKLGISLTELTHQKVLAQDLAWVEEADCLIAEVSSRGSYGTGGEIEHFCLRKQLGFSPAPLLMLFQKDLSPTSSFILGRVGPKEVWLQEYENVDSAEAIIKLFLNFTFSWYWGKI